MPTARSTWQTRSAGPGGEPASADDSELANGFQPKVDVSIVGNIDAAGNMTIPPSGVVFPPSYVKLNHPVDGSVAIVRVDLLPTAAATGTLNPLTGQMVLNVKLRAKLSGDLWGNSVSSDCSIGTAGNPIAVRFTTHKLPSVNGGPALSGSKYDPAGGTAMLVSNDFYVPGASGCLAGGWLDINDTINQATKLPSQVGKNLCNPFGQDHSDHRCWRDSQSRPRSSRSPVTPRSRWHSTALVPQR